MSGARLRMGLLLVLLALLVGCAPAATPAPAAQMTRPAATSAPAAEAPQPVPTKAPEAAKITASSAPTQSPQVTRAPEATRALETAVAPLASPTLAAQVEKRVIELEWPQQMQLGESDVLRLALVPSADGYTAVTDFEEHPLATQQVQIQRPPGYTLYGLARLDGPGFEIAPAGEQILMISPGLPVTWRWSIAARSPGRQRLSIALLLRWEPEPGVAGPLRESSAFNRGLQVEVRSFLGLTRLQAGLLGLLLAVFGLGLGLFALLGRRPAAQALRLLRPNPALAIEAAAGMSLSGEESQLFQALFQRYARVVLESEFLSGYSGARTFLVRPVQPGGLADAATIVKIGPNEGVRREYANYERFVRDRLPPVTARIQHVPVTLRGGERAALQYTCIAEPGRAPRSLRQALLETPDPALLQRLFDTFGPNWWMQRRPYAFRLGLEYDRLLPPQLVLAPLSGPAGPDSRPLAAALPGDGVRIPPYRRAELRGDGASLTLWLEPQPGQAPLRLRWLSPKAPLAGAAARVVQIRAGLLAETAAGFERFGLPDPLTRLDAWLQEPVQGTLSTIHGDLNLENALVGPGGLVWLIDFAETREGHTLYDFAHLQAEIAAHLLAPRAATPLAFLEALRAQQGGALMQTVEAAALRCLFDPASLREYRLALALACLGGLKYANLSSHQKHCLYLLAADQAL